MTEFENKKKFYINKLNNLTKLMLFVYFFIANFCIFFILQQFDTLTIFLIGLPFLFSIFKVVYILKIILLQDSYIIFDFNKKIVQINRIFGKRVEIKFSKIKKIILNGKDSTKPKAIIFYLKTQTSKLNVIYLDLYYFSFSEELRSEINTKFNN